MRTYNGVIASQVCNCIISAICLCPPPPPVDASPDILSEKNLLDTLGFDVAYRNSIKFVCLRQGSLCSPGTPCACHASGSSSQLLRSQGIPTMLITMPRVLQFISFICLAV